MTRGSLRPALCEEVYLYFGNSNRELLQQAESENQCLEGARIGAAVLRRFKLEGLGDYTQDPEAFFKKWLNDQGGGELPKKSSFVRNLLKREDELIMDYKIKWVGLAVLVGVSYSVWRLFENRNTNPAPSRPNASPPKQPKAKINRACISLGIFANHLPSGELVVSDIADLVSKTYAWWVGEQDSWMSIERSGILTPLAGSPSSDGVLIVLVVNLIHTAETPPSSRLEVSSLLRAAAAEDVEISGKFTVSHPEKLNSLGFKR